jgi:hypothetical protein
MAAPSQAAAATDGAALATDLVGLLEALVRERDGSQRLREALARYACDCNPCPGYACAGGAVADCGFTARAALPARAPSLLS